MMEWPGGISASPTRLITTIVLLLVVDLAYITVSRLVLSPVAKFPGPKLAGLTFWYEFYYDVVKGGRYTFKIRELHEKYGRYLQVRHVNWWLTLTSGPIIRINPYEIHVDDPAFYYKLYTGPTERRDKWHWSMKMFGMNYATFATVPHDLHRRRRAALNPSFSKAAVYNLEPEIRALVNQLCKRLKDYRKSGEPVNLGLIFSALTTDVITGYSFGKSYECLQAPDFNPQLHEAIHANTKTTVLAKQFNWIIPLSRSLPHWMVQAMDPAMMQMVYFAEVRPEAFSFSDTPPSS